MSDFTKLKTMLGPAAPPPPPEPLVDFEKEVKAPKRGGLPIGLIASIQKAYQQERKDQENADTATDAKPAGVGLKPGWGGKGR